MSLNDNSPRLCDWQKKILHNAISAGDEQGQAEELKRLEVLRNLCQ